MEGENNMENQNVNQKNKDMASNGDKQAPESLKNLSINQTTTY